MNRFVLPSSPLRYISRSSLNNVTIDFFKSITILAVVEALCDTCSKSRLSIFLSLSFATVFWEEESAVNSKRAVNEVVFLCTI